VFLDVVHTCSYSQARYHKSDHLLLQMDKVQMVDASQWDVEPSLADDAIAHKDYSCDKYFV